MDENNLKSMKQFLVKKMKEAENDKSLRKKYNKMFRSYKKYKLKCQIEDNKLIGGTNMFSSKGRLDSHSNELEVIGKELEFIGRELDTYANKINELLGGVNYNLRYINELKTKLKIDKINNLLPTLEKIHKTQYSPVTGKLNPWYFNYKWQYNPVN